MMDSPLRALRADALLQDVTFAFDCGATRGAHRCVLALHSPVFRRLFDPSNPMVAGATVPLVGKAVGEFELLLEYFYSSDATLVRDESAVALLALAEEYQVGALKKECEAWLVDHVDAEQAVDCLLLAQMYNCAALEATTRDLLVKEFEGVAQSDGFGALPPELLADALQRDELCVGSEEAVFLACARWHSLQAPPPPADVWEGLLRCVRFHTMDLAYLRATVVRHPALRASPKLAAAVARLASPSAGKAARRRSNKRPLDGTPERAAAAASSSSSGGGETSAAAVAAPPPAEAAPSPPSSSSAAAASSSMPTAPATATAAEEGGACRVARRGVASAEARRSSALVQRPRLQVHVDRGGRDRPPRGAKRRPRRHSRRAAPSPASCAIRLR